MPRIKVAHIYEQGQNMLLFPLDGSFGRKTAGEQNDILNELEVRANSAGLPGRAAAFWTQGVNTYYRGPRNWQAFLSSVSMGFVWANVNQELSWS